MTDFDLIRRQYRERAEAALERHLPTPTAAPTTLHAAMRYASLGGGKRLRAMLVYAAGELFGAPAARLDPPAAAVELIHAYSLVHDDLPAMDDDDLRRGRPSCHRRFDEATAILAGDALQALAFEVLAASPELDTAPAVRTRMIASLARASGSAGMAGGQAVDLQAVGTRPDRIELERMHAMKTGALIEAAVNLGALAGNGSDAPPPELGRAARAMGLAFQVADDLLDVQSDTATLGKETGMDAARHKPTYVSVLGVDGARHALGELHAEALACLRALGDNTGTLRRLADFIVGRDH